MPNIHVNIAQAAVVLREAATILKSAIAVSAAAILSQAKPDLDANAAAAKKHFDGFRGTLRMLHDAILQNSSNAAALAVISRTSTIQVDSDTLDARIALIESRIESTKEFLLEVVGSPMRNGIDDYAEFIGSLGHAFQKLALSVGEPAALVPFQFHQFFLQTMADLGQRDWRDTVGQSTP